MENVNNLCEFQDLSSFRAWPNTVIKRKEKVLIPKKKVN